jgi:hypothetical protein
MKIELNKLNIETLNEEFCYAYFNVYNKLPKPDRLPKDELLVQINRLNQIKRK